MLWVIKDSFFFELITTGLNRSNCYWVSCRTKCSRILFMTISLIRYFMPAATLPTNGFTASRFHMGDTYLHHYELFIWFFSHRIHYIYLTTVFSPMYGNAAGKNCSCVKSSMTFLFNISSTINNIKFYVIILYVLTVDGLTVLSLLPLPL